MAQNVRPNRKSEIIPLDITRSIAIPIILTVFLNSIGYLAAAFLDSSGDTTREVTILRTRFEEHRQRFDRYVQKVEQLEQRSNDRKSRLDVLDSQFRNHNQGHP